MYGQKGVDGGSKRRESTRETEVGLDRWCEGGLGQQRDVGRGWASMREEPWYICNNEFPADIFAWPCVLVGRFPVLWWLSPGGGGMPLDDAVGIN